MKYSPFTDFTILTLCYLYFDSFMAKLWQNFLVLANMAVSFF